MGVNERLQAAHHDRPDLAYLQSLSPQEPMQ